MLRILTKICLTILSFGLVILFYRVAPTLESPLTRNFDITHT